MKQNTKKTKILIAVIVAAIAVGLVIGGIILAFKGADDSASHSNSQSSKYSASEKNESKEKEADDDKKESGKESGQESEKDDNKKEDKEEIKQVEEEENTILPYYEMTGNDADEDITITWCIFAGKDEYYQYYWKEMKGLQKIQENTGVQIDFQVKTGYEDYLPMFTAKRYPDVITAKNLEQYRGRLAGMYEDGISVRLNEYMNEGWMPNFTEIVETYPEIARDLKLDDGSYTFVASLYDVNNENDRMASSQYGLAIRKDWLDNLGYGIPTNMDEWHNVLVAFKNNDPNGNGIADEEPVCMAASGWKYFLSAYGIDDDPCIQMDASGNETVVYGFVTDAYRQWLTQMNQWNNEGLIYNMFENTSLEKRQERVTGNYAGAWKGDADHFDEEDAGSYISLLREMVPDAEFAAVPWVKTADGYQWCFSDITSFSRDTTVITDNAVNNGTDQAAAYIIDYMLGEEGSSLLTWGIEGESYDEVNGEKQLADDMTEMVEFHGQSLQKRYTYADPITVMLPQFGEVSEYILSNKSEGYVDACKTWSQGDTSFKISSACQLSVEQQKEVDKVTEGMKEYISKMRMKFIQGSAPLEEYDAYVSQVKAMGGDSYAQIWQEAYDNYQKR